MAEALLKHHAQQQCQVASAGMLAGDGGRPSSETVEVLKERGIIYDGSTTALCAALIDWADIVLAMTQGHKDMIQQQYPSTTSKVFTLREYVRVGEETAAIEETLKSHYAELEWQQATQRRMQNQSHTEQDQSQIAAVQTKIAHLQSQINDLETQQYNNNVADPFGSSLDEYRKIREELTTLIKQLWQKIRKED